MPSIILESLDDPRIEYFRRMRDRELAVEHGRFIAEGEYLVERLIDSDFELDSILVSETKHDHIVSQLNVDIPVYVAPNKTIRDITGFGYTSGVYACAVRKPYVELDALFQDSAPECRNIIVCPKVSTPRNLGSITRIGAAFGVSGILLGPECCDPFYRRSVRVSMGAVYKIPYVRSTDLVSDLRRLKDEFGIRLVGTILDDEAESLYRVADWSPEDRNRMAIILGNEDTGLEQDVIELCDRKVMIPMHLGTDSLNVSVSAALFMYEFARP